MPIKYNLTRYDTLASKIKKVSLKKDPSSMTKDEMGTMLKAVLIASFASGHSWQTYKYMTSANGNGGVRSPELKKEFIESLNQKWKMITPFDIGEISTLNISDTSFSAWLFTNVDKEYHEDFNEAWRELKAELSEACDEVEREQQ